MRLVGLIALVLVGCHDAPAPPAPSAPPLVAPEPIRSAEKFTGCDGPPINPVLAILDHRVLIDGTSVSDSELESVLNAKQDLNALLGGEPIRDIYIQVATKVPEARVAQLLARAKNAGFVHVIRMEPIEEAPRPTARSGRPKKASPRPAAPAPSP